MGSKTHAVMVKLDTGLTEQTLNYWTEENQLTHSEVWRAFFPISKVVVFQEIES